MNVDRLGAIDIGSNSVKLLICDVINYKGRIVSRNFAHVRVPLQLGEDTFCLGCISDRKKEELVHLIRTFKSFIEISGTEDFRLCATSALREASNRQEVVDMVYATTGATIELISTKDEAGFIFLGGLDEKCDPATLYVMADVGGGCTEIAFSQHHRLLRAESFDLGTIRTLSRDQEKAEWVKLKACLEEERRDTRNVCLVGSGDNINKIYSRFRRKKIRKADLKSYYDRLSNVAIEERVFDYDLNVNRAKVILPAMNVYLNVMKILKIEFIYVPVISIADGIIKDLYRKRYSTNS
jgi:exopolyphosphatase/guanosine-5'-triphosphate,3'-diphosphate pyrophosphatase